MFAIQTVRQFGSISRCLIFSLAVSAMLPSMAPAATIRYVDASASSGGSGMSWSDAYDDLQDALSEGGVDEIWVADGVYTPTGFGGSRLASFQLVSGVAVYGGFAGDESDLSERDPVANLTTLSGDLKNDDNYNEFPNGPSFADNSFRVVKGSGTDSTAVLDGFTISGGNANTAAHDSGGGLYCDDGSPTLSNCVFRYNYALTNGGGLRSEDDGGPQILGCLFSFNEAGSLGGGVSIKEGDNALLAKCYFDQNSCVSQGGGLSLKQSDATLHSIYFYGNEASSGGALINESGSPELVNVVFVVNSATGNGAGMLNASGSPSMVNCTWNGNIAGVLGGGLYNTMGSPGLQNCILWGNSDGGVLDDSDQIHVAGGSPTVTYSIMQGGWELGGGGEGNLDLDPLLVEEGYDLRPLKGSPAVDAGNNAAVPADVADLDNDGNTTEPVSLDAGSIGRFLDDPEEPDSGVGTAPIVDMGAYELYFALYLYVDKDATGAGHGLDWANAFTNLQAALAVPMYGSRKEIWVAEGTYRPDLGGDRRPGDRTASFVLSNDTAIYGGFEGDESYLDERDIALHVTILSGDLYEDDGSDFANNDENSYHVVTGSGTDSSAVLDGFTITGGNANVEGLVNGSGGGMFNDAGSPSVAHCRFVGNSASGSGFVEAGGGGMKNHNGSSPTVIRCDFIGNRSLSSTGSAGGMDITNLSSATVVNCRFYGNSAGGGGGAVRIGMGGATWDTKFVNCVFSGNSAGGAGGGGAMALGSASPELINCTLVNNTASSVGGGLFTASGGPRVSNCIVWGNTAFDGAGSDESAQIFSSPESGCITVTTTVVQGLSTYLDGTNSCPSDPIPIFDSFGNIGLDPLFVDADGADNVAGTEDDDLRVAFGSPVIDAGDNSTVPPDAADLDDDDDTLEAVPLDLDGHSRFIDNLLIEDQGVGPSPIVDMGAYEFTSDCNGNDIPDDLEIILSPSVDCNINGVLDDCEIDPDGGAPGGPYYCQQDCDSDCNVNGIPDECDIADCSGNPPCGDCNLNGIPDSCDIAAATSQDVNLDGVPDECVEWDAGGGDQLWSTPPNWQDNDVPGDGDPADIEAVVIEGEDVVCVLDIDASVDSVLIGDSATLDIAAGNLTIDSPNGIENNGTVTIGDGFAIIAAAPITISGSQPIRLNGPDAAITSSTGNTITNEITLAGEGVIDAELVNEGVVSADVDEAALVIQGANSKVNNGTMEAIDGGILRVTDTVVSGTGDYLASGGTMEVTPGAGGAFLSGQSLLVTNDGTVEVFGDVDLSLAGDVVVQAGGVYRPDDRNPSAVSASLQAANLIIGGGGIGSSGEVDLDGTMTMTIGGNLVVGCGAGFNGFGGRGGCTPPVLHVSGSSELVIGGDLDLIGAVDLLVDSTEPVMLGGDFDNQITVNTNEEMIFDWANGGVTMNGVGTGQAFEAAGEDRGADPSGFDDNFAHGTLELAENASVSVQDLSDNQQDGGNGCNEALYVGTLILNAGSELIAESNCFGGGVKVYYQQLINNGGTIAGLVLPIVPPCDGDANDDGMVDPLDSGFVLARLGCPVGTGNGECDQSDQNGDGVVDPLDVGFVLARLGGCE